MPCTKQGGEEKTRLHFRSIFEDIDGIKLGAAEVKGCDTAEIRILYLRWSRTRLFAHLHG